MREPKTVTVFGAGVSGLSAAHELVARGFEVTVVDPDINEFVTAFTYDRGVGGMARSQFAVDDAQYPSDVMKPLERASAYLLDTTIVVTSADDPSARAREVVEQASALIAREHAKGRPFSVGIRLPTRTRTRRVEDDHRFAYLSKHLRVPDGLALRQFVVFTDTTEEERESTVFFDTSYSVLPAEHGFRFFPSFYRHLFDTMKRTPISKPKESETGARTVYDNLVAVESLGFAREGRRTSFLMPRRPAASFEEFRRSFEKMLGELEWSGEDLARFSLKLFEYATSSTRRRNDEYERMSWSDFVDLPSYTPTMQEHIEYGPQMMLSLRGSHSDARTQGNTVIQLLLDQIKEGLRPDSILSAPTSSAWFDHWHRYLLDEGVLFRRGRLARLAREDGKLVPVAEDAAGQVLDVASDYYVLALSVKPMVEIARAVGLEHLRAPEHADLARIARFLDKDSPAKRIDPLRDMSGIQFYFDTDVRFWRGHSQYLDSEWGLTSIAQQQFWAKQRSQSDAYRSVLSVDIGIWDRPTRKGKEPITAHQCTDPTRLAEEVWAQIVDHHDEAFAAAYGPKARFPYPRSFALDQALTIGTSFENRYPFLVNVVGQFLVRPGELQAEEPKATSRYCLCDGIVMAGTHMKTYTRITSMEAANESARHAVNRILDDAGTPADHCEIWDPEDWEFPDLAWLREIDDTLAARGLPHFVKILGWTELPSLILPDVVQSLARKGMRP